MCSSSEKEETLLVDLYSNHDPNICKIETTELRDLIEIWGQAQKMYKNNNLKNNFYKNI